MMPENDVICVGNNSTSVTVRMYNLNGEGDCFLLTFHANDGSERYILIDSGIFTGTSGGAKRLRKIAKDIKKVTGKHLHAVIITHEHWDHIVGFQYARETFFGQNRDFQIDELWLAWTENVKGDELAKQLNEQFEPTLQALQLLTSQPNTLDKIDAEKINKVLAYRSPAILEARNLLKTTEIMDKIQTELASSVRYFSPEDPPLNLTDFPGMRFYTLGPPIDELKSKLLKESGIAFDEIMLHDEATYFNLAVFTTFGKDVLGEEQYGRYERLHNRSRPFGEEMGLNEDIAQKYELNNVNFFEKYYGFDEENEEKGWRQINYDWLLSSEQFALYIDEYVNNTSLALAIQLKESGKVLLFPGDAEHDNWASWEDLSWTIEDPNGESTEVKGICLMQKTAFYKASHHGSHNGTLKEYLAQMHDDLVVMIPCNQKWACEAQGWEHPDTDLLRKMETKTRGRIIRADTFTPAEKPETLTLSEWNDFMENVQRDPDKLWIQYTIHDK